MAAPEKLTYGSYEVLQNPDGSPCILGQGSFGVTYKARHVYLGRINALKVIREDLLNRGSKEDHEETKRFLEEARAVGRLHHPGIAMVHDCALDNGVFYYAMEYCDGGTLQNLCEENGPLPWSEVRRFAIQIASALDYAHASGFLHRDIKPANIMLNGAGKSRQAKLIDFGLAKKFTSGSESSSATVRNDQENFRGNFATASPEQILEKPLDQRSDLFSFGVTLWWLLIGKNPFGELKRGHLIADRVASSSYASSLPAELESEARSLLESLLEKDAEKRIASANEVVERLGAGAMGATPPSKPIAAKQPLAEPPDLEPDYKSEGILTKGRIFSLYKCTDQASGQPVLFVTPEDSSDVEAIGRMRIAAHRKLDLGAYAFLDWRMSGGQDAFVISKPAGASLLAILRKFGPARFSDALPFLIHLARCFDSSEAWTTFGIQVDPDDILVSARDGTSALDRFRSWADLDPQASRCLPFFSSATDHSNSNEATISTSSREFHPVAQFAALVYRVLAGKAIPYAAFFTPNGYVMASGLSEDGNTLLADTICAPETQPLAYRFLQVLANLESLPIGELPPLVNPPTADEIEIGKLTPISSHVSIGDVVARGHIIGNAKSQRLDNSVSVNDRVAALEQQLAQAKRDVEEEARRAEEQARVEAEARQRAAEEKLRQEEESQLRAAEEMERQAAEARRQAEELARQAAAARQKATAEAEAARLKAAKDAAVRKEAEAKRHAENLAAEAMRVAAAAEAKRQAEELARQAAAEETRRKAEEIRKAAEAKALSDAKIKEHEEAVARHAADAKKRAQQQAATALKSPAAPTGESKPAAAYPPVPAPPPAPPPAEPPAPGPSKSRHPEFSGATSYRLRIAAIVGGILLALGITVTALIMKGRPEKTANLPVPKPPGNTATEVQPNESSQEKTMQLAAEKAAAADAQTKQHAEAAAAAEEKAKQLAADKAAEDAKAKQMAARKAEEAAAAAKLQQIAEAKKMADNAAEAKRAEPKPFTVEIASDTGYSVVQGGHSYTGFKIQEVNGERRLFDQANAKSGIPATRGSRWKVTLLGKLDKAETVEKELASTTLIFPEDGETQPLAIKLPTVLPTVEITNDYDRSDYTHIQLSPPKANPDSGNITLSYSEPRHTIHASDLIPEPALANRKIGFPAKNIPVRLPLAASGDWTVTYTGSRLDDHPAKVTIPKGPPVARYSLKTPSPFSGQYSIIAPMTRFPDGKDNLELKTTNVAPINVGDNHPPEVDYFNEMVYLADDTAVRELRVNFKKAFGATELPHFLCAVMNLDLKNSTESADGNMTLLICYPHAAFTQYQGNLFVAAANPSGRLSLRLSGTRGFAGAWDHVGIRKWADKYLELWKPKVAKGMNKFVLDSLDQWVAFQQDPTASSGRGTSLLDFRKWTLVDYPSSFHFELQSTGNVIQMKKAVQIYQKKELYQGYENKDSTPEQIGAVLLKDQPDDPARILLSLP